MQFQDSPLQVLLSEENITEITAEVEGPGTNVVLLCSFIVSHSVPMKPSGHPIPWRDIQNEANSPT